MRTQARVLFQLQAILYRGSYPGPYSFHCYAFTTAAAQRAIDVCNTNPARDKLFHNKLGFLGSKHGTVSNLNILWWNTRELPLLSLCGQQISHVTFLGQVTLF